MRFGTTVSALAAAALLLGPGAGGAAAGQITSYTTQGNLKVTHDLGCIAPDKIRNEYTPPDLMNAFSRCVAAQRYDDGAVVWLVAGTYAFFDAYRVTDATARDAFQVLLQEHQPDEKNSARIKAALAKYSGSDSAAMATLCADLKRQGPPDYRPDYMIAHGMGAFLGGGAVGAVAKDFDVRKGWRDSLKGYLHCDVSDIE